MTPHTRIYHILLGMMLALTGSCANTDAPAPGTMDLSGQWELVETVAGGPELPDYRATGAVPVTIPGRLDHIVGRTAEHAATVWLRKRVFLGRELAGSMLVLSINNIGIADEAYVNGVCVGASGTFPAGGGTRGYDLAWHRDREYHIPAALLRPDRENLIAIKVFFHVIDGVRERPSLSSARALHEANRFREFVPSANNLIPLILALLLYTLLIISMKGAVNRRLAVYSNIFIMAVFGVTVLMLGLPRFDDNLYRFKLFLLLYVLADFSLILFIQEFFSIRSRALTAGAVSVFFVYAGFMAWLPSARALVSIGAPVTAAVIVGYILAAIGVFLVALTRDPRRYWYLALVGAYILVSAADTLHCLATGRLYLISYSFALRLPLLLFGALLVHLLDLRNARSDRDILTAALLNKTNELRRIRRRAPRDNARPEPRDTIHQLIEHLDENFTETYDRLALARRFNMNEDYMVQLFKKVTGTTISSYINTRRIEASKQLLVETESKVIDIAFHVGFDNLTYFYRTFKKHIGYSPVEYRRMAADRLFTEEEMAGE
ncbi:MAG TPA: AraC family transcriptional regulator [Spirochaetota bacterium]|nr:AraC family transcriptional regulator [Spirochaetota bacterium]